MIVRIATNVAQFLLNMLILVSVMGFLMAGGVVIKLWRNRP